MIASGGRCNPGQRDHRCDEVVEIAPRSMRVAVTDEL